MVICRITMGKGGTELPTYDCAEIGMRIKSLRIRSGMTQAELAEEIGCSVPYLSYVENGRKTIAFEQFLRVLDAFSVSADELLTDEESLGQDAYTTTIMNLVNTCTTEEKQLLLDFLNLIKRAGNRS